MKQVGMFRGAICSAALMMLPVFAIAAQPQPQPQLQSLEPWPDDQRDLLSEELGRLFAAGAYAEALPVAREIVLLTEAVNPGDPKLATAYENLGRVQLRAGDAAAAEASLVRALDLLAETEGIASPRPISPLRGLAEAYRVQGRPAAAVEVLQRSIAISQRALGLFNAEQLTMLEPLIELYGQLGNGEGMDRELQRSVMIAERVYGNDDPRLLPLIERLARRYEQTDRVQAARQQWARMIEIASHEGGGRDATTVKGLLGISRSHRLQYVRDPRSIVVNSCRSDPETGQLAPLTVCTELGRPVKLDDVGEEAASRALAILESTTSPPPALLAAALLELGDWYVTARRPEIAIPYYQRAWPLLSETSTPGQPNPLLVPRPLDYRTPAAAVHYDPPRGRGPTGSRIEFILMVKADGQTTDIKPVSDAPEARLSRVRRALEQAWFSPRFVDGHPVATEGYRFVEYWQEPVVDRPANTSPDTP